MPETYPQIFIKGFPKSTREKDLEKLFQKFGTIKQARIVNTYAFIGFENEDSVKEAVKEMNQTDFEGNKLKVQVAGRPKKSKGPQPDDLCRYCNKPGHWKNSCPDYKRRSSRYRNRSRSESSSSSSSDRHKKKRRHRRRSPSSDSDSSSNSSRSSSSKSRDKKKKRSSKKQQR